LFLAYVMDFVFSLQPQVNWRFMLGILFVPAVMYVGLGLVVLPESPRWLVSKGRMNEAKKVLQKIRGRDDVDGEMSLLVEGLGVGAETHIEEWLLKPSEKLAKEDDEDSVIEEGQIKLFGPDDSTWVATPIVDEFGHSIANTLSRSAMAESRLSQFLDPVVTMMGSVQNSFHDMGFMSHDDDENRWDEENQEPGLETSLLSGAPISRNNSRGAGYTRSDSQSKNRSNMSRQNSRSRSRRQSRSGFSGRHSRSYSKNIVQDGQLSEFSGSVGVGGGWQLAWRWDEGAKDGEEAGFKRVFVRGDGGDMSQYNSTMSLPGVQPQEDLESFQAQVIVAQSSLFSKELLEEHPVGPAMMHPAETATRVPPVQNLWDAGVKRALFVGVILQILQQFSGINAVLYFTPQILMQSGAGDILSEFGLDPESSSILASGVTCFLMLPCIFLAMKLMDVSGRRGLLLTTLPALTVSLVALVIVNLFKATGLIPALISFICVTVFICSFVAGFGPIPNILCSEIFPTRVRGTCIGICAGAMWSSNVCITYAFPILNQHFGLQGVFGFFAIVTFIAWIFVFQYVPETKGQPLEIICEIFALAARSAGKRDRDDDDY